MKCLLIAAASLASPVHADPHWTAKEAEKNFNRLFSGELEVISDGHQFAEGMAFDAEGNFYFTDVPAGKLFKVDKNGKKNLIDGNTGKTNGIALGPDGKLYGCAAGVMAIHQWDLQTGKRVAIAKGAFSNDIVITKQGRIYFTDPKTSAVWSVSPAPDYKLTKAAQLEWKPNGIGLHPKEDGLMVAEFFSDTVHRFPIARDGSLGQSRPYYQIPVPRTGKDSGKGYLDGMVVLPSNKLMIGTVMGIQLIDSMEANTEWGLMIPPFGERPRCNYVRLSPDAKWLYAAFKNDLVRIPLSNDPYINLIFKTRSTDKVKFPRGVAE